MTPAIVKKGLSGILHEGCLIHQLHSSTSAASVSFISLKPNTLLVYVHHAKVWAWPVHRRPWALELALWLNRSLEGWLLILSSFYRYGSFWYPIISRPASPTLGPNCFILQNPSFEIRTYPSLIHFHTDKPSSSLSSSFSPVYRPVNSNLSHLMARIS